MTWNGRIYEIYKNLSCGLCEVISLPFSARFWVALAYVLSYDYFISFFSCHDGSTTLPCLALHDVLYVYVGGFFFRLQMEKKISLLFVY